MPFAEERSGGASWARVSDCARSGTSIAPAAGRWSWSTASPTSATCAARTARPSSMCAIRRTARSLPASPCRPARIRTRCGLANGLMVVNHELNGADPEPGAGRIPRRHRHLRCFRRRRSRARSARWTTAGKGVHRFDFDGRYAYMSPTLEGYVGTIVLIMDLEGPGKARGGRPLVDAGAMDGGRRDSRRGPTTRTAATIRCGSATASTPATGWPASSSSTSRT